MPSTKRSSPARSWADATPAYVGSSTNMKHISSVISTNAIRSRRGGWRTVHPLVTLRTPNPDPLRLVRTLHSQDGPCAGLGLLLPPLNCEDRKSTRLNSSHANISYAVFCLKK